MQANRNNPLRSLCLALGLALGAIALTGCATPKVAPSGFLASYDALQPSEETGAVKTTIPAADKLVQYTAIQIAAPEMMESRLNEKDAASIQMALQDSLVEALAVERQIASAPGPMILLLRYAIVRVDTSNVALNVVTTALVGAVDYGSLAIEAEVTDSVSGDVVAAMTWARGAKPLNVTGAYSSTGHARALAPDFAKRVAALISKSNAK